MKLKYYLRGMGIGIILTAIVMGFALGGRKQTLSDAEIIQRARALGMIEAGSGTLSDTGSGKEEEDKDDASTSDQTLDKEGEEISEEEQQEITSSDNAVSEVAEKEEEGEGADSESIDASSQDESNASGQESQSTGSVDNKVALGANETEVSDSSEVSTGQKNATDVQNEGANKDDASTSDVPTDDASAETTKTQDQTQTAEATTASGRMITIPGGMGSDQVAAILYKAGIVDNAVTFNRYLIDRGVDRIIRSGTKTIPEGATYEQVADIITKG